MFQGSTHNDALFEKKFFKFRCIIVIDPFGCIFSMNDQRKILKDYIHFFWTKLDLNS